MTKAELFLTSLEEFLSLEEPMRQAAFWRQEVAAKFRDLSESIAPAALPVLQITPNRRCPRSEPIWWLACLVPEISPNVQSGVYPLLLFDPPSRTLFNGLAVAWNQFGRRYPPKRALALNLHVQQTLCAALSRPVRPDLIRLSSSTPFARILEKVVFDSISLPLDETSPVLVCTELAKTFTAYAEVIEKVDISATIASAGRYS